MKGVEKRFYSCINSQELDNAIEEEVNNKKNSDDATIDKDVRRHLPAPTGPYSVGCVDIMTSCTEDGSFFRLYYPTEKTDIFTRSTQWPPWLPRKQYGMGYAHFLRKSKLIGKLFNWLGGDVYIPALWQAPILDSDKKCPVVILSHGLGGNRTTYSTFCCELASQGFIVAAVEHRDGTASMTYYLKDNLTKNTVELIKDQDAGKHKHHVIHRSQSFKEEWRSFEHTDGMGIKWDDYKYRHRQETAFENKARRQIPLFPTFSGYHIHVLQRVEECSKLLDILSDLNKGCSVRNFLGFHFSLKQFKDRMDLSKVAFAGHSFGGATCIASLAKDKRYKVGVILDGWMHPVDKGTCREVTQPLLLINYEQFQWKTNVQQMSMLEQDKAERKMITLKGACHQAITDFQFLVSKTFGRIMEVRSDLSPKIAMDVNRKATLAFFSKHLDLEGIHADDSVLLGNHDHVVVGTTLDLS